MRPGTALFRYTRLQAPAVAALRAARWTVESDPAPDASAASSSGAGAGAGAGAVPAAPPAGALPSDAGAAGPIAKKFAFPTHTAAAAFVARVAAEADAVQHHPDVAIKYRWATFRLRTNDIGALTEHDAALATRIDELFAADKAARKK